MQKKLTNTILSDKECKILMQISLNISKNETLTISEVAKKIKISINNPKFYRILKILKEHKAIEVVEIIGPSKFVKINNKKIVELLIDHPLIDLTFEFLKGPGNFFIT